MEVRNVLEVGDDGWNLLARSRVDQMEIVSDDDLTTAGGLEDLAFDVAVERDACDRGRVEMSSWNLRQTSSPP